MAWQRVATGQRDAKRTTAANRSAVGRSAWSPWSPVPGGTVTACPVSLVVASLATMARASRRIAISRRRRCLSARRRTSSACPVSQRVPSCSWRGSRRAWAIQSRKLSMLMPSSRATWLTGTVRDRVSRTAWWQNSGEYGATYGRMIGTGRSSKVAVTGPGWSVEDVPVPVRVPEREQCVDGP